MLKCLFICLFSAGSKKKDESLCKFCNKITQPFLNLEDAPNSFHRNIKKTQQQKSFDIQHQFQHSTPCPNDMIHTLINKLNQIMKCKMEN